MTTIAKVEQELEKFHKMQGALQKEVWTKANYEENSKREDLLWEITGSLSDILRELQLEDETEYISLNER